MAQNTKWHSLIEVLGVGWVAHVILVSVQVLLVLTLGLWTFDLTWDLGLTILKGYIDIDLFISFPG